MSDEFQSNLYDEFLLPCNKIQKVTATQPEASDPNYAIITVLSHATKQQAIASWLQTII